MRLQNEQQYRHRESSQQDERHHFRSRIRGSRLGLGESGWCRGGHREGDLGQRPRSHGQRGPISDEREKVDKMIGPGTYKEHNAVATLCEGVCDRTEGDAWGADTVNKEDLLTCFRAELIDSYSTILMRVFQVSMLSLLVLTGARRITYRSFYIPSTGKSIWLVDQVLGLLGVRLRIDTCRERVPDSFWLRWPENGAGEREEDDGRDGCCCGHECDWG